VVVESLRAMRKGTAELAASIDEDARTGSEKSATPAMRVSREAAIALVVSVLAVGAMAVDHLIGESDPGESDSFPVDTTSFVVTSLLSIALVAGLFGFVVRRAPADNERRLARRALVFGALAVLTVPLLFAGVPFAVAGAAIALGLMARERGRERAGTTALVLGVLVVAFGVGVYVEALIS
jgi:hypothetical protein